MTNQILHGSIVDNSVVNLYSNGLSSCYLVSNIIKLDCHTAHEIDNLLGYKIMKS